MGSTPLTSITRSSYLGLLPPLTPNGPRGMTTCIGPGSPTGTRFGYGARFPAKYQEAFYVLDWSWGKIYAVHLEENGASY